MDQPTHINNQQISFRVSTTISRSGGRSVFFVLVRDRPPIAGPWTISQTKVRSSRSSARRVVRHIVRPLQGGGRGRPRTISTRFSILFLFLIPKFINTPFLIHFFHTIITPLFSFSSLFSSMDPSQFPNPNSADDDMPMFGGGRGDARWPGHEHYRVETPESVGSTFVSSLSLIRSSTQTPTGLRTWN